MEGLSPATPFFTGLKRATLGAGTAVLVALLALGAGFALKRLGWEMAKWQVGLATLSLGTLATLPFLLVGRSPKQEVPPERELVVETLEITAATISSSTPVAATHQPSSGVMTIEQAEEEETSLIQVEPPSLPEDRFGDVLVIDFSEADLRSNMETFGLDPDKPEDRSEYDRILLNQIFETTQTDTE